VRVEERQRYEMRPLAAVLTVLVIASLGVACGGDAGGADAAPETHLEISVLTGDRDTLRFDLECEPVGGSAPNPTKACAMLPAHPEMLDVPEMTATCVGSEGIPPEITVTGESQWHSVSFAVRGCDAPDARASSARLWLEALDVTTA
jgi:hypothetical protein